MELLLTHNKRNAIMNTREQSEFAPINVQACKEASLLKVRKGKTAKDRASGAKERSMSNRAARVEFDQQTSNSPVPFPKHACNGKKNRSRYTSKEGHTVVL